MSDPTPQQSQDLPSFLARPLRWWERIASAVPGAALSTFGTIAVFVTENQAGSTALLLIGAVLMLVGIQGAPLQGASKNAVQFANIAATQELTTLANAQTLVDDGKPDAALTVLEKGVTWGELNRQGVTWQELAGETRSAYNALAGATYERLATDALMRVISSLRTETGADISYVLDHSPLTDGAIIMPDGKTIQIEFTFNRDGDGVTTWLRKDGSVPLIGDAMLVVTNMSHVENYDFLFKKPVRATAWNGSEDDVTLKGVLTNIISEIS